MKKLPIGIQDFSNIIKDGYIYIDKTKYLYKLINGSGKTFFLSRPRRFGKSLLINTLDALFKGEKKLFKGLFIEKNTNWKNNYPVIKIDWTTIGHVNYKQIKEGITQILIRIGENYNIKIKSGENPAKLFEELIYLLYKKTNKKVVVLIDEYDVPILDNIEKPKEIIEEIREFLQGFYRILKASDEYLQFVFLTGVTKFTKVSVFSALNNIIDISLDKEYASICGWTQNEIEDNLSEYIELFANEHKSTKKEVLDAIQYWYNGFSWDGNTFVYNPFSTLLLLKNKKFENYWFSTGTPAFLINLINKRNDLNALLNPVILNESSLNSFDYSTLDTKLLLFQTGYLTIKKVKEGGLGIPPEYTLEMPNNEVRNSLLEHLISSYFNYPLSESSLLRDIIIKQLIEGNDKELENQLNRIFAGIPHQLHIPKEAYYHSLFLLLLNLLNFDVQGEVSTDKGRIDAVLYLNDYVYITEIKYTVSGNEKLLLEEAIKQIRNKKYYEKYLNKKIKLLAIAFCSNTISCKIENYERT